MDAKTQRQEARRRAREVRSEQEQARKVREQRLEDLAVTVLVAVGDIAEHERRAGEALRVMVEVEGLTLREALRWCGDEVSVRTASRFRRSGDGGGVDADDSAGGATRGTRNDADVTDGADGAAVVEVPHVKEPGTPDRCLA